MIDLLDLVLSVSFLASCQLGIAIVNDVLISSAFYSSAGVMFSLVSSTTTGVPGGVTYQENF